MARNMPPQLRTVYDPGAGYDPLDLFGGLAAANYSRVNPDGFKRTVKDKKASAKAIRTRTY